METTIAAISTPLAVGGIGVVRLSGEQALSIAQRVFEPGAAKQVSQMAGYTAAYGHVRDSQGVFDEAVLTVFRAPRSYTGEDVAELSCHGGLYLVQRLLRAVLDAGAVPAQAGEFTKRAFLNGKISLTQAEAVGDLIAARSDFSARAALSLKDGALYRRIQAIQGELLALAGHLSAWVDYPEEEMESVTPEEIGDTLARAGESLQGLLDGFGAGQLLKQGIDTAIVGRPNAGKSTLMNLLSQSERSIVTQVAGTTRDIVENTVRIGDMILNLADTAGLRETQDPVEQIGVQLARRRMQSSALVLAVFDSSQELDGEDLELLKALKGRCAVAVVNKVDLPSKLDLERIRQAAPQVVLLSASQGQGLPELQEAIARALQLVQVDPNAAMLANERQRSCAAAARQAVLEALECLQSGYTLDAVTVCVTQAIERLGELSGTTAAQAVVDEVFSKFCVGK